MDTKDILKATQSTQRLIQNEDYYKYIFKKTERIVSVVFYVLNSVEVSEKNETHIEDITHAARTAHDAILQTLEARAHTAEDVIRGSAHALLVLLSKLTIAHVAGVFSKEVVGVFTNEIDAVLRGMNKYLGEDETVFTAFGTFETTNTNQHTPARTTSRTMARNSAATDTSTGSVLDRRVRIRTILEAKGEATIKDISELIKDCSEKTIQRELNAMIEDNVVKRHGARRWSKYSLF